MPSKKRPIFPVDRYLSAVCEKNLIHYSDSSVLFVCVYYPSGKT